MTQQIEKTDREIEDIYKFASLEKYTFSQRIQIRLIAFTVYWLITIIGKTITFEEVQGWEDIDVAGYENYETVFKLESPGIFAYWHNRIFLMANYWKSYKKRGATMSSQSFDGEYSARIAQKFGYGVIRGSTSRDGAKALKKMVRLAEKGVWMSVTVDGPRGPRYKVQNGVVHMAKQTGLPIGAMLIEAKDFWTLNSWDKLQIPKPFTKAKMFIAEPVFVGKKANKRQLQEKHEELQNKLDELVELGKQWRESNK